METIDAPELICRFHCQLAMRRRGRKVRGTARPFAAPCNFCLQSPSSSMLPVCPMLPSSACAGLVDLEGQRTPLTCFPLMAVLLYLFKGTLPLYHFLILGVSWVLLVHISVSFLLVLISANPLTKLLVCHLPWPSASSSTWKYSACLSYLNDNYVFSLPLLYCIMDVNCCHGWLHWV